MGQNIDFRVEIRFSEDNKTAFADLFPPSGKGRMLSPSELRAALDSAGVVEGILPEALIQGADLLRETNLPVKNLTVAVSKPPIDETPEYFKLKKRFFEPRSVCDPADIKNVDYKMVSPFILVDKGEAVAKKVPAITGQTGMSILGQEIPFGKKNMVRFDIGENLQEGPDGIVISLTDGCFERVGNQIKINETLVVSGDVDYHTGHITFSGDVVIFGTIKDGFRVVAGGNIYCKKTLDASHMLCKGNLLIEGGIIGRKSAQVRVHGKVETRYIEYCDVESLQGISVKSVILNSHIYTLGELILGEKSALIASRIEVEQGITVLNIGREGSFPARIICGQSFVIERKLIHVEQQYNQLIADLDRVMKLPSTEKNNLLIEKIQSAAERMQSHAATFRQNIYTFPQAKITVKGSIFPGTILLLCGVELHITEKLTRVQFSYDSENKQIITDTI